MRARVGWLCPFFSRAGLCTLFLPEPVAHLLPCCCSLRTQVALAEQELCAMGKRRQHQEKLEAVNESKPQRRSKPVRTRMSFGGRDKKKAGSSASGKPTKPQRHSLDNVGDHEVKVHALTEGKRTDRRYTH